MVPLEGPEKQPKIFMVFSWVFNRFAQNLRVFMAYENWKIKRFLISFLMFFFMLFPGWHAMKILLKSYENPVNLPWINSQDFHGFLVHSARIFRVTGANQNARKVLFTDLVNTKYIYIERFSLDCRKGLVLVLLRPLVG